MQIQYFYGLFAKLKAIYLEKDALGYASGHQYEFSVKVLNKNNDRGVISIPRLRLGH